MDSDLWVTADSAHNRVDVSRAEGHRSIFLCAVNRIDLLFSAWTLITYRIVMFYYYVSEDSDLI